MIKRSVLTAVALVFAFGVMGVSIAQNVGIGMALTGSENYRIQPAATGPAEKLPSQVSKPPVDYFLVYPGILPDHFLYPIKMIRDRIWLWLTIDDLAKSRLMLLFADKRLGAGKVLVEGNKVDFGATTITKAEKYLEMAVNQYKIANEKGKDTRTLKEKLSLASLKHEEILLGLKEKLPPSYQPAIESALGYARRAYQEVK